MVPYIFQKIVILHLKQIKSMKALFKFVVIVSAVIALPSSVSAQKSVYKAVLKTSITCDHCKQCETCGGLLEKTLIKEKGVQMITLDEKASTITVIYNSNKTDIAKIKQSISKMGYDADDVKADPAGYEKLDGCCKENS